MTSTPTPAQRVTLEAIKAGRVLRYFPPRWVPHHAEPRWVGPGHGPMPRGVRRDTVNRCVKAGWARVVTGGMDVTYAPVDLTDAGREALACHS